MGEDLPWDGGALEASPRAENSANTGNHASLYETSLFPRLAMNTREKRAIAALASSLIDVSKTLFIDGGTSSIELAKVLASQAKGLTVVTNSTLVSLELGWSNAHKVIGLGGSYDPPSASFVGRACEEAAAQFFVDYAVFSTKGLCPGEGTFESNTGTLRVKQVVADHCQQAVLLVDHTKFNERSLCKVLDMSQIHVVVTDEQAPQDDIDALRDMGIEVLVASLEEVA
jgi:DeoR/GlpR family transcriptional regulator of sugar metabolism